MKRRLLGTLAVAVLLASTALNAIGQDKVVLTMWHNHPEWKDRVEAILAKFEEQNPTIDIQLEEIAGPNYQVRVNTALAAGEAPDLFMRSPGPETAAAAEAGYIVDLTDKLDISGLTDAAKNASTIDGKVWSVPVLGSYTVGLYYHRKIFADNNLTPPTTMEEFHAVCKALQEKGITPMIAPAQDGVIPAFLYMMLSSGILGADGFDKIRTGEKKFTDPDVLQAAVALKDMYPCFQEGSLGTPYVEGKALFALGQGAMLEGGSADFAGFQETNKDIDVGVVPFPAATGGKPSTVTGMEGAFAINSKSAHIDDAVKFLQFMLGKDAAQMVVDTITLTTTKGVLPSNNRVMAEMLTAAESRDVRVFYEFPQTGDVMKALQDNAASLFIGDLTPEQFSQKIQDAVKPGPL